MGTSPIESLLNQTNKSMDSILPSLFPGLHVHRGHEGGARVRGAVREARTPHVRTPRRTVRGAKGKSRIYEALLMM